MKNNTLQLYDYHLWANEKVFQHLKELPREVHHQEIQSVFPAIYEALVHMCMVDTGWLSAMSGESFDEMMALINRVTEEAKGRASKNWRSCFWMYLNGTKRSSIINRI